MNEMTLTVNVFEKSEVRHIMIDGNPWWVASDVCAVMGIQNTYEAINGRADRKDNGLDEDEKLTTTMSISGQNREVWLVNEYGLYSLILKS